MPRDPDRLDVFSRAHSLALDVYRLTEQLPESEQFGLRTQIRRACVSVTANIAEGCGRRTAREYARFVDIAAGSATELRYLLVLAEDLGMLPAAETGRCRECSDHVVRALKNLQQAILAFEP